MTKSWRDETNERAAPPLPPPIPPPLPPAPAKQLRVAGAQPSPLVWAAGGAAILLLGAVLGWTARGLNERQENVRPIAVAETSPPPRRPVDPPKGALEPAPLPSLAVPPASPPPAAVRASELVPPVAAVEPSPEPPAARVPPTAPSGTTTTPPATIPVPVTQPATPRKTASLFQELDIQRMPKFSILGSVTVQDLQYRILSELKVGEPDESGVRTVEQTVVETRLIKSDDLSRTLFEQSLQELKGWQFTFKLNRAGQIVAWKAGPADGKKTPGVEVKGAQGFLVTSVLDEDGWKELTQLSFFVPEEQARPNQVWSRPMAHDFGSLGSWYGQTDFQRKGTQNGLVRYDYAHKMTYQPPEKDRGGLPFTVKSARFKAEVAGGSIGYDPQAGRVHSAQDRFLLRGEITSEILGQSLTVPVEEQQVISLRLVEQNPWASKE